MSGLYENRDIEKLEPEYCKHVEAMTAEGLHDKSDIAAELAWRDRALEDMAVTYQGIVETVYMVAIGKLKDDIERISKERDWAVRQNKLYTLGSYSGQEWEIGERIEKLELENAELNEKLANTGTTVQFFNCGGCGQLIHVNDTHSCLTGVVNE